MARGRKSLTPDERLAEINCKIDEYTEEIKMLKEEKEQLKQEIHTNKLNELYEIIQQSGKTIDEVKLMLAYGVESQ